MGIDFVGSSKNVLTTSTFSDNGLFGIALAASSRDNTVKQNVASGNGEFGIAVFDSSNNLIQGNTALLNTVFDAVEDGVTTGNDWVNNTFGTTFGI